MDIFPRLSSHTHPQLMKNSVKIGGVNYADVFDVQGNKLFYYNKVRQRAKDLEDVNTINEGLGIPKKYAAGGFVKVIKNMFKNFVRVGEEYGIGVEGLAPWDQTAYMLTNYSLRNPSKLKEMAKFIGEDVDFLTAGSEATTFVNKAKTKVYRIGEAELIKRHNLGNFSDLPGFVETFKQKRIGDYYLSASAYKEGVGTVDDVKFAKAFSKLDNVVRNPEYPGQFYMKNPKSGSWYLVSDLHTGNIAYDAAKQTASIIDPGSYFKILKPEIIDKAETLLANKSADVERLGLIQKAFKGRYGRDLVTSPDGDMMLKGLPSIPFSETNVNTKRGLSEVMAMLDAALGIQRPAMAFGMGGMVRRKKYQGGGETDELKDLYSNSLWRQFTRSLKSLNEGLNDAADYAQQSRLESVNTEGLSGAFHQGMMALSEYIFSLAKVPSETLEFGANIGEGLLTNPKGSAETLGNIASALGDKRTYAYLYREGRTGLTDLIETGSIGPRGAAFLTDILAGHVWGKTRALSKKLAKVRSISGKIHRGAEPFGKTGKKVAEDIRTVDKALFEISEDLGLKTDFTKKGGKAFEEAIKATKQPPLPAQALLEYNKDFGGGFGSAFKDAFGDRGFGTGPLKDLLDKLSGLKDTAAASRVVDAFMSNTNAVKETINQFKNKLSKAGAETISMTNVGGQFVRDESLKMRLRDILEDLIMKHYRPSPQFATGGAVIGSGGPKQDNIPAMLSPGEFVVKAASARNIGYSILDAINKTGKIPKLKDGALVDTGLGFSLYGPRGGEKDKKQLDLSSVLFGPKQYKEKTFMEKAKEFLFGKPMTPEIKEELKKRIEASKEIDRQTREKAIARLFGPKTPEEFAQGGLIRGRYQAGGGARKFVEINGEIYEETEKGLVKRNYGGVYTRDTKTGKLTDLGPAVPRQRVEGIKPGMDIFHPGALIKEPGQDYPRGPEASNFRTKVLTPNELKTGAPEGFSPEDRKARAKAIEMAKSEAVRKRARKAAADDPNIRYDEATNKVWVRDEKTGKWLPKAYQSYDDMRTVQAIVQGRNIGEYLAKSEVAGEAEKRTIERQLGELLKPGMTAKDYEKDRAKFMAGQIKGSPYDTIQNQAKELKSKYDYIIANNKDTVLAAQEQLTLLGKLAQEDPSSDKVKEYIANRHDTKLSKLYEEDPKAALNLAVDQARQHNFLNKYIAISKLTNKGALSDREDLDTLGKLLKDTSVPILYSKMKAETAKAEFSLPAGINPYNAFLQSPKAMVALKEALRAKPRDEFLINKLKEKIASNYGAGPEEIRSFFESQTNKQEAMSFFDTLRPGSEVSPLDYVLGKFKLLRNVLSVVTSKGTEKEEKEAEKSAAQAVSEKFDKEKKKYKSAAEIGDAMFPVMHSGGTVQKTGPIFAEAGEVVIPKKFAEGGIADAALRGGSIKVDVSSDLAAQFKAAADEAANNLASTVKSMLDGVELKVEDVELKVEDKTFPVEDKTFEIESTTIKVDASAAASAIQAAIESAKVQVTGGGAVGADEAKELSTAITDVKDQLIAVKTDLSDEIRIIKDESVTKDSLKAEVVGSINDAMTRVQNDITINKDGIASIRTELTRLRATTESKFAANRQLAQEALNFSTRPGI